MAQTMYIVTAFTHDDFHETIGIFSSEEKARIYIMKHIGEFILDKEYITYE